MTKFTAMQSLAKILTVVIFLSMIYPVMVLGESDNESFNVKMVLISDDCSYETNGKEILGLIDIAHLYLWSFGFPSEFNVYCVNPNNAHIFFKELTVNEEDILVTLFSLNDGLWTPTSYTMFGYLPPKNISNVGGEIFFKDKTILMSYSLIDDFNSPILTHELMHFVLSEKGFGPDVYINQVHKDWAIYKDKYQQGEKIYSYIAEKYYYVFG